jgi:hypothetical protein
MLKQMTITVKRISYETIVVNSENGYDMPVGTKETVDFVSSIKTEIQHGDIKSEQTDHECIFESIEYEDE